MDYETQLLLAGRYCELEAPVSCARAHELFRSCADQPNLWTYMPDAFATMSEAQFVADMTKKSSVDRVRFAVVVNSVCVGTLSHIRITPAHGVIEVGTVIYSKHLAKTVAATEAQYLAMQWCAFLGLFALLLFLSSCWFAVQGVSMWLSSL